MINQSPSASIQGISGAFSSGSVSSAKALFDSFKSNFNSRVASVKPQTQAQSLAHVLGDTVKPRDN
jgi:hypothetical protein